MGAVSSDTLNVLRSHAEAADTLSDWPIQSWEQLRQSGALTWGIPTEFGGTGLSPVEILSGNEQFSSACLTTTFILSQREAAVRRLLAYPVPALQERYLSALAQGTMFLTVGLSQLTTSRQHQSPVLRAERLQGGGIRLDGEIPWVTGADHADALVVGATQEDGRQILLVLPTKLPGIAIEPPMVLAALRGSRTSLVRCLGVVVEREQILAGPEEQVLGKGGGGGLETSCLALGLAGAAIDHLQDEAKHRPEIQPIAERLEKVRIEARRELHTLGETRPKIEEVLALRVQCTRLALRNPGRSGTIQGEWICIATPSATMGTASSVFPGLVLSQTSERRNPVRFSTGGGIVKPILSQDGTKRMVKWLGLILVVGSVFALGREACRNGARKEQRPNIILILVDDLGYGDLSCYGCRDIRTPHLDALAKQGVRLTDAYASAPVCSPTRAALMTGRYPQRSGFDWVIRYDEKNRGLPATDGSLPRMLKNAGYRTALFGKWHLGYRNKFAA